ncbi:FAD-dependent oxidoreductase [Rhizoctonia solani AG-3 Rhs1AP]|uniref:FAD-dependent oxidoreductase n=1 Tax=Rhizoctonia solani AG-3 Rhs1AP TaxID=1086054 RepID=X8J1U6_9AGAM|nr:FAD-dependent oxidoreductase [Rhizoctonia solani AG-3 Rhs1AP]
MNISIKPAPVTLNPGGGSFTGFTDLPPYTPSLPVPGPTKSFWLNSDPSANPLAQVGSASPLPHEASVVIIGSGITGCSVAFHLARLFRDQEHRAGPADDQLKLVLLEARDFCGYVIPPGRNGGHLTAFTTSGFRDRAEAYGTGEALRTVALEQHTVSSILNFLNETPGAAEEVDLVQGGRVTFLLTSEQIEGARKDIKAAAEAGVDMSTIEWLEPDATAQRFGPRQTSVYTRGNTLWPLKLATKLYQVAKSDNQNLNIQLDLFTHTPVTSVESITEESRHNCLVKTSRGDIKARFVVHATNGYASYLLPHLANPLGGIVPTQGQCIAIRGSTEASKWPMNACRTVGGYEYWFPRPPQNVKDKVLVILGGSRKSLPQQGHNIADDSMINPTVAQSLRDFLPEIYPGEFEECKVEMEWTGIMGFTRSGDPMVGPVFASGKPVPHQYISAGYSGHGMPRAFACAEVVAGMIDAEARGVDYLPHGLPEWMPRHMLTAKDIG